MINQSTRSLKRLIPILLDVALPLIGYYIPRAFGASPLTSIIIGGILSGLYVTYTLVARHKLDQFGLLVLGMLVLGFLLLLITGDARLALAKPAAFVLFAALSCFATLRKRPAILSFAKPMATDGNIKLEALWEKSWRDSAAFRQVITRSTVVFATALLVDAIGRVIIAYAVPIDKAVTLVNAPGLIAIILAIRFHLKTVKPVFEHIKKSKTL